MRVAGRWAYLNGASAQAAFDDPDGGLEYMGTHDLEAWVDGRVVKDGQAVRLNPASGAVELWREVAGDCDETDTSACGTNPCVDNYCCDEACGGECEACNLAGHEGVCTAVTDGTACTGGLCRTGACNTTQCLIDGQWYDDGAVNPANECQACVRSASGTSWTNKSGGTACSLGICNGAGACIVNPCAADEVLELGGTACWKRCPQGQTWNGSSCTGTATTFNPQGNAISACRAFANSSANWRLATTRDYARILGNVTVGPETGPSFTGTACTTSTTACYSMFDSATRGTTALWSVE